MPGANKLPGWDLSYTMRQDLLRMDADGGERKVYVGTSGLADKWFQKHWQTAVDKGYVTAKVDKKDPDDVILTRTAKEVVLGEKPVYGYYFTPDHRTVLANWPEGETRTIEVFEHNLNRKMWEEGAKEEYYSILEEVDTTHLKIYRTDKKMRTYKPRKKDMRHDANSVWPWNERTHWDRMQSNPIRHAKAITKKLSGADPYDLRLNVLYPSIIGDSGMLKVVRADLENVFTNFEPGLTTRSWVVSRYIGHGVTLRLLFLDLMVEPQFDESGKFQRFVALDANQVKHEYEEWSGGLNTDNPIQKYKEFMRIHHMLQGVAL